MASRFLFAPLFLWLLPGCLDLELCSSDADCPSGELCGANNLCFAPPGADAGAGNGARAPQTPNDEGEGEGDAPPDESPAPAQAAECDADQEEELRESLEQYDPIPIPDDCSAAIHGTFTARYDTGDFHAAGDPDSIRVRFEEGVLTEVNGVGCEAVSPGKILGSAFENSCTQYFLCECCAFALKRAGGWEVSLGAGYSGEGCPSSLDFRSDYVVPWSPEGEGGEEGEVGEPEPAPTPTSMPNNACGDCLTACSGSPFCCTQVGCNCYEECYTPPAFTPNIDCDPDIQICN